MRYITTTEATAVSAAICAQIDAWTVLEVGQHQGPGLGGSGYGCTVGADSCATPCTQSVCVPDPTGSGGGSGLGSGEGTELWAILTFVCVSVYIVGGVGYQWHTKKELKHPHFQQWMQVKGLVVDGFHFSKAKYSGETWKPPPPSQIGGDNAATEPATGYGSVEGQQHATETSPMVASTPSRIKKKKKKKKTEVDAGVEDADEDTPRTKKKKKKKKTKQLEDAPGNSGIALE